MYSKKARAFYDETYYSSSSGHHNQISDSHYHWIMNQKEFPNCPSILDLGCGTGDWLLVCSRHLDAKVTGIDISEVAIAICKLKHPEGRFICGRSDDAIPIPAKSVDVVTSFGALEHFENPLKALREMHRTLADDGIAIISVPNKNFLGRKLGIFKGTGQANLLEISLSNSDWGSLFKSAGFVITMCKRDFHMANRRWLLAKGLASAPFRALALLALLLLPAHLQYQNYFWLSKNEDASQDASK